MGAEGVRVELFGSATCYVDNRSVPLPPGKPTLLLAVLALGAGSVVRTTAIMDALWGEEPPTTARALVHTYVSTLRKAMALPGAPDIETLPGGYRMRLLPDAVDVHRLLAAASSARVDAESRLLLQRSGEPLLGGVEAPVLEPWQLRVDRARGALQDRLWALALEEGDADRVVPELEAAVRLDPLREDRVLLLAQAFAALGRTGEALAALDAHRRTVASELGLDPSLRVARLRQQLLAHPTPPVSVASGEGAAAGPAADTVVSPRRRPPRRVVAATVLGAAGVAALSWWVARRDEVPGVAGSALLEVDSSGRIAAVLDLPVTPSELAAAGSTVWVASAAARAVGSVDLRGARDLRVIGLDQPPSGVAAAGGSAVVGLGFSGDVVTVHGGRASAPRPAAPGAAGRVTLAAGPAGTWVATIDGEVHAPAGTSGWTTPVALERSPVRMSVDAGRAWVLASAPSELVALTSGSHSPVVSALRGEAVDVTSARGHAWVVTADENRLWHASPDDARVVGTTVLPGPPVAVAVLGDRVWVAVTDPPALVAHSWADLRQQASVALPRTPVCLAASDGNLVVAVN